MSNYNIDEKYLGGYRKIDFNKEDYYMSVATLASINSLDPSTQVGVCYVDSNGEVLSTGYNQPPTGWDKDLFPWSNNKDEIGLYNTKYPYIIHAEVDGIKHNRNYEGATCYVTLFPCLNCARNIVNSGVKRVVYLRIYDQSDERDAVFTLFNVCGVKVEAYDDVRSSSYDGVDIKLDSNDKNIIKIRKRSLTPQFD